VFLPPRAAAERRSRIQPAVFRTTYFAGLAAIPLLAGCSGARPLSHEELQSNFRASISLASETEAFLNHRAGHTYSAAFTQGHISYLEQQGSDLETDLAHASAETHDLASLDSLRTQTRDLTQTIDRLRSESPEGPAQQSSIHHLDSIRTRLEAGMPR
jgi:hypothetical protein